MRRLSFFLILISTYASAQKDAASNWLIEGEVFLQLTQMKVASLDSFLTIRKWQYISSKVDSTYAPCYVVTATYGYDLTENTALSFFDMKYMDCPKGRKLTEICYFTPKGLDPQENYFFAFKKNGYFLESVNHGNKNKSVFYKKKYNAIEETIITSDDRSRANEYFMYTFILDYYKYTKSKN